jgi:hypothetical protein
MKRQIGSGAEPIAGSRRACWEPRCLDQKFCLLVFLGQVCDRHVTLYDTNEAQERFEAAARRA